MQPARRNQSSKKTYTTPILQRLNLQQAKVVLSSIKNIFSATRSNCPKVISITSKAKKRYQKPGYQELTPEQIKFILIGQFNLGDEGAGDLLDQLFPESHTPMDAPAKFAINVRSMTTTDNFGMHRPRPRLLRNIIRKLSVGVIEVTAKFRRSSVRSREKLMQKVPCAFIS